MKTFNTHEVAEILADLFGDSCACNFNGIDEWLPEKCELLDSCPNTVGVACWEQYLKFREEKPVSDDVWEDYDRCYECRSYGDDYHIDEHGELVSACDDCSFNGRDYDDD